MIFGVGIDLCDAGRLEKSLAKQSFLDHVFAPSEQALLASLGEKRRAETAAANFAAKEAFLKAAGTGLGGFAMPELAVLRQKSGAPYFALTGAAAAWVREQGLTVHVSLTHERGLANARVLLEKVYFLAPSAWVREPCGDPKCFGRKQGFSSQPCKHIINIPPAV